MTARGLLLEDVRRPALLEGIDPRRIELGRLDGRDGSDLHVRPYGDPVFPGLHHVDLRYQIPETAGMAAGFHVYFRRRLRSFLFHRFPG